MHFIHLLLETSFHNTLKKKNHIFTMYPQKIEKKKKKITSLCPDLDKKMI